MHVKPLAAARLVMTFGKGLSEWTKRECFCLVAVLSRGPHSLTLPVLSARAYIEAHGG